MITEEFVEKLLEDSKEILNQIDINILWWIDKEYEKKSYSSEAEDEYERKLEIFKEYDCRTIFKEVERENERLFYYNVKTISEFEDFLQNIKDEIKTSFYLSDYVVYFERLLDNIWNIRTNDEQRINIDDGIKENLYDCICV